MRITAPTETVAVDISAITGSPDVGKARATEFVENFGSIPPIGAQSRHCEL